MFNHDEQRGKLREMLSISVTRKRLSQQNAPPPPHVKREGAR